MDSYFYNPKASDTERIDTLVNLLNRDDVVEELTRLQRSSTPEEAVILAADIKALSNVIDEVAKEDKKIEKLDDITTKVLLKDEEESVLRNDLSTDKDTAVPESYNYWAILTKPLEASKNFIFRGRKALAKVPIVRKADPREIDSIVVFILCASIALWFRSSPDRLKLFRDMKNEPTNAFVKQYYGYIETFVKDDSDKIIRDTIAHIKVRSIVNINKLFGLGQKLSSLTINALTIVLKSAVAPVVYLIIKDVLKGRS